MKEPKTVDLIVFRIKIRLFSGLGFLFIYFYFLDICIVPLLDILLRGALYMRWPMWCQMSLWTKKLNQLAQQ